MGSLSTAWVENRNDPNQHNIADISHKPIIWDPGEESDPNLDRCKTEKDSTFQSCQQMAVPSGCSLMVMDSLRAEPRPLALDDLRFQGLELPSGVEIAAEQRICESLGENNGSHRLGGREYSCHQQHLTIKSGTLQTLLPAGCVRYHQSPL